MQAVSLRSNQSYVLICFIVFCRFWTTIILSVCFRNSDGLKLSCDRISHSHFFSVDWMCLINVDVSLEKEELEFDHNSGNISTITNVILNTTKGYSGLTEFPFEIFQVFPNITCISVESNLEDISQPQWQKAPYLKTLKLERNQLTIIRRQMFVGLDKLRKLELRFNKIHEIESDALDDLPHLWVLDLSHNKLTTLSNTVFSKIPKLAVLNMHDNELTHIGRSIYTLRKLQWIDLHRNYIDDIDLAELSKLPLLNSLMLWSSGLSFDVRKKQDDSFVNTSLDQLDISINNLTNVEDLNQLSVFKRLTSLYLAGNRFTNLEKLSAEFIKGILPNLETLGWDGTGSDCAKFNKFINQCKSFNITIINLVCFAPPCLSCDHIILPFN